MLVMVLVYSDDCGGNCGGGSTVSGDSVADYVEGSVFFFMMG